VFKLNRDVCGHRVVHAINGHGTRNGARASGSVGAVESCQRGQEQAGGRWWQEAFEEVEQEQAALRQLIGQIGCRVVENFVPI